MKIRPTLKRRPFHEREPVENNAKPERRSIWDGSRYRTIYTRRAFVWRGRYELYFSRMLLKHAVSELSLADFAGKQLNRKTRIRFFSHA